MRSTVAPFAVVLGLFSSVASTQSPPNTLLIIADDVGVDGIGCYQLGSAPPPTPNIDALAGGGVRFTNAHVCPTCSPTRASLLTGRHGFRIGIGVPLQIPNDPGLDPSEVLLPEVLAPAGIATALIGKWHLGNDLGAATPTADGFGEFTGSLQGAVPSYYQWPKVELGATSQCTNYATSDCVDEALDFVGRTTAPWLLVVSFNAAHTPYEAPPAALHSQNLAGLDPNTTPLPFYKAMVEAMDAEIGRLLAGLTPAVRARTNVVFLGDNGTAPGVVEPPFDPARSKGTIYQGGVRVPLIVNGPVVGGAPRVEPAMVHGVDLMPTLAALQDVDAAVALPAGTPFDGVDFSSLLAAPGQAPVREFLYTQQFTGSEAMATAGDAELMRDARFELLRFLRPNGQVREEMYDLQADPFELVDLLQSSLTASAEAAYATLRRELAKLRGYAWSDDYGAGCAGGGIAPELNALTEPSLGATFQLRVQGLSGAVLATIGVIGFDDQTWNGVPLPGDLSVIGMPGCSLLLAPALYAVLMPGPGGGAPWPIALPSDPAVVGAELFTQAFPLLSGANAAGIIATAAIVAVVGS